MVLNGTTKTGCQVKTPDLLNSSGLVTSGEPDSDPEFACVSIGNAPNMVSPKKWVDGPCETKYDSDYDCLCKIYDNPTITTTTTVTPTIPTTTSTTLAPTTTTTSQDSCGEGWSLYDNACYTIMNSDDQHYSQYADCRYRVKYKCLIRHFPNLILDICQG